MTDVDLVARKLTFTEQFVQELVEVSDVSRIEHDIREQRFVVHTLQLAIQASIDVASRIVSDERLGEPRTDAELFQQLSEAGYLPPNMVLTMKAIAGFRNMVIYHHEQVDRPLVRQMVEERLPDLLAFVEAIRKAM